MTLMWGSLRRGLLAAGAVAALAATAGVAEAQKTLRVVMHSDLKILDPIWTSAYIARNHGYMIYDTLFAEDANGGIKPQMADKYAVSEDQLTHTITLREGLMWHDGAPVTAEDCAASIKRWGARDSVGQKLMTFVDTISAPDAKTIVIKLKSPTGLVLIGLGKPSSNVPFMMPKRVAETDPATQISDFTGSGPFVFKKDEWKVGDKAVYVKFDKYKPRAEPASGLAGGKVVNLDRVEWRAISDQQQAINALIAGEVDLIEQPSHDLLGLLKKDANLTVFESPKLKGQFTFRPNPQAKPFDDPRVRQALWYAFNQQDFLMATVGDAAYIKECKAYFVCGAPFASTAGMDDKLTSNFKRAQELLKETGYDGTPIILLHSTDLKILTNLAPVAKNLMEKAGFKVDMQSMDWSSLLARRAKKVTPPEVGWHGFLTAWFAPDILNPIGSAFLNAKCGQEQTGAFCDEELEKLRDQFAREADPAKQKALAEAVQRRAIAITTNIPLGEYLQPMAFRKSVFGVLETPVPVFWNMDMK